MAMPGRRVTFTASGAHFVKHDADAWPLQRMDILAITYRNQLTLHGGNVFELTGLRQLVGKLDNAGLGGDN
jgi:hypothetical protein